MTRSRIVTMVFALIAINLGGVGAVTGQTWGAQDIATGLPLDEICFTDADHGWVVGDAGVSFATLDGGQTWNSFFLTNQDLQGVAFRDASLGLIVGDDGLVFRSIDGGVNWGAVATPTSENLDSVAFGSGGKAYAVGRDATIIVSSDDGASWILAETGTLRYRSVWAVGPDHAWVASEEGVIRATTNGGVSWFSQNSGTGSDLKGVCFVDTMEGWMVGQNSTVLYTNDGGANWQPRAAGIQVGLDSVFFVDMLRGWAVGNLGTIYATVNGGLTWIQEPSGTGNELNDVFFVDASAGWTVGDGGTVLARFDVTAVDEEGGAIPSAYSLKPNYPNPFNPTTTISFELPATTKVDLAIFDAAGYHIKTLIAEPLSAGSHAVVWDGRDQRGRGLSSGLYIAKLITAMGVRSQKLVLAK